ncbi:MAG TPA: hypothetical protein VFK68_13040 [Propionibacteriaceae bacterium]|nr:hypothetical protein [Propionibacteriaceae bacterium]
MPGSDEQWSRISAEAELRPEHGVVADVPTPQITPQSEDEAPEDPIELTEVPPPSDDAEVEPETPSVQPIQVVPFHSGPLPEPGPDVIVAAPFEVPTPVSGLADDIAPEMITDVPEPGPDTSEEVPDLPEEPERAVRTPWWRLLLGRGGRERISRSGR